MKKFGFTQKIATRFISIIDKENIASINVAKKSGMDMLFEMQYLGMEVYVFGAENRQ